MSGKYYLISETEAEIMEMLWECSTPMQSKELLLYFNEKGKGWKRQTLNTFLTRLKSKGLIEMDGKTIKVLYDKGAYQKMQTQEILNDMYGGDIQNFLVAFSGKESIARKEENELLQFIENFTKEE